MERSAYIHDNQVVKRAKFAVKIAIEKKQSLGIPAVVYNRKTGEICHLQEDGSKVVVTQRKNRRRYSERVSK